MQDDIDETKWLPRDEPILTTSRSRAKNVVAVEGDNSGYQLYSLCRPLDFYVARRYISDEQYRAGDRLFMLWKNSILYARYARMNYGDYAYKAGSVDLADLAIAPKAFLEAKASLKGRHRKQIILQVCLDEKWAGPRKPMILLKEGLDQLADYFKSVR